jgi:cytochrome c-type biogenesis protein CcmF
LILWMWIGGLMMAFGTVLSAFPGRRRRDPLDPVSARVPERAQTSPAPDTEPGSEPVVADA